MKKNLIRGAVVSLCLAFPVLFTNVQTVSASDIIIVTPEPSEGDTSGEQENGGPAEDTIPKGVYIGAYDVGGKTAEEAGKLIDAYIEKLKSTQLVLSSVQNSAAIPMADLSLTWSNREETLTAAVGNQNIGNLIAQYKQAKDLQSNNLHLPIEFSLDVAALADYMVRNLPDLEMAPKEPSVVLTADGFSFQESVDGFSVDYDATYEAVLEALNSFDGSTGQMKVDVAGVRTPAAHDMSVFEGFGDILGEWTTYYDEGNVNRSINVKLATSKINGTVMMPGQEFSFCQAVQPFTAEEGYKEAGTYIDGISQDDLGGGVCQVSSTLYNAVLWSELQTTYRANHSKTVTYVKPSMDAMVYVRENSDFRFVNSTEKAIYIESYAGNGALTFRIYGTEYRPANRTIDYESEIKEWKNPDPVYKIRYDTSMPVYTEESSKDTSKQFAYTETSAHPEVISQLYKHVYVDGVEVSKEYVEDSYSKYNMEQGVLVIHPDTVLDKYTLNDNLEIANIYLSEKEEETTTQEETEEETTTQKEEETTEEDKKVDATTAAPTPKPEPTTAAPTPTPTPVPETTAPPETSAPEETAPAETVNE